MKRVLACFALIGSVVTSQALTLVPVSSITGHHKGDGSPPPTDDAGAIVRVTNGFGTTQPDPADPGTWTHDTSWETGWQGGQITSLTLNQGWIVLDLGAVHEPVGNMYLWNVNEGGGLDRGFATYQIYVANSPTVTPPIASATAADYDFSSGGWTTLGGIRNLPIGTGSGTMPVSDIVNLNGVTHRYIGLECITNHGNTSPGRTGLAELALTKVEVIVDQPVISPSDTVWESTPVTIAALGSGVSPAYQWYMDTVLQPDETNATLSIASSVPGDSGDYYVTVSNEFGTATSDTVTLTVNALSAPIIVQDPQSVTRYETGSATMSVVVDSPPGATTLQWAKDTIDIPGATNDTLSFTSITSGDAGSYTVVASNAMGSTTSAPGVLSIRTVVPDSYEEGVVAHGPIGYWRMDETNGAPAALDYMNGHDAAHNAGVSAGNAGPRPNDPGPIPSSFNGMEADNKTATYNGVDGGSTTGESLMNNVTQFTMMCFINPVTLTGDPNRIGFIGQNDMFEYGIHGETYGLWINAEGVIIGADKSNLPLNEWSHLACVGDGTDVNFYLNGVELVTDEVIVSDYGSSSDPFNIGYAILDASGNFFDGSIDEVAIYDKALTRSEVNEIYVRSLGQLAPIITVQSDDAEVVLGTTNAVVTFEIQATGTAPLTYQWKKDAVDVPDATNALLTIVDAGPAHEGTYTVEVSNIAGSVLSDPATLTIICGPVSPPEGITTLEDDTAEFTVTMPEDSTGYLYQWSGPGGVMADETNAVLTLTGVKTTDSGAYSVEVTLGSDMVTSDLLVLSVLAEAGDTYANIVSGDAPTIFYRLGEPFDSLVAVNEMDPGGFNDGEYWPSGTTARVELGVTGALLGDADTSGYFPGTEDSKVELLDTFDIQTPSITVELWAMSTGGSGFRSPITSRDLVDASNIDGWTMYATDSSTWQWRVAAGEGVGGWTTLEGGEVVNGKWTHLAGTYDSGTKTMAFYVDGVLVGTATNVDYTPDDFNPMWVGSGSTETTFGGFFWVGGVDEVAIYNYALDIGQVQDHFAASFGQGTAPVITFDPPDVLVVEGASASMTVGARGLPVVTYQWQKDGLEVPGANSSILDFPEATPADDGLYRCIVANPNGAVTSEVGRLEAIPFGGVGISFNLQEWHLDQIIAPSAVAGYFPLANWNSLVHTNDQPQADVVDASGAPVGLDVRWSLNNTWGDGTAGLATPDRQLARGYWDDGDGVAGANGNGGAAGDGIGVSVTVLNVPYATYSVVLYRTSDQGTGGAYTTYSVNGVGQTSGTTTPFGDLGGWVLGENMLIFQGLTSGTLEIAVNARDGVNRGSLSGFQIISPETAVLPSVITTFMVDGAGDYSLSWDSVAGTVYAVESESDLENGPWAVVPGAEGITATGDTTSWSGTATDPNSNYRVVTDP